MKHFQKLTSCFFIIIMLMTFISAMTVSATENFYTVDIADDIYNGIITSDKTTAAAGETVTLTITPDNGYTLKELVLNAISDYTVLGKTEVSFTMPEEDVAVFAIFNEGFAFYFDNSDSQWTYVFFRDSMGYAQGIDLGNDLFGFIAFENESGNFTNYMRQMPEEEAPEVPLSTADITPEPGKTYRYTTHSANVAAVDVYGNNIAGATLQILDSDGVVAQWTSTNKAYEITDLKNGEEYTLRSVGAPYGYLIPADTTFTIDEEGKITSDGMTTEDDDGNTVLLLEFGKTIVRVSAVDGADGMNIEGATIQILEVNNNVVDEWVSTKEAHETEGLKIGVAYILRTIFPVAGYTIPDDTVFSINEHGDTVSGGSVDEYGTILIVLENTIVRISAIDVTDGEKLAGATMQIVDLYNNVVEEWISEADDETTEDVDESIQEITGLNVNEEFVLKVTIAPQGYTIPSDITFTIDEIGNVTSTGVVSGTDKLLVRFTKTAPIITSVTFNSDSPAYDAQTNTFCIDENNELLLTVEGQYLKDQRGIVIFANIHDYMLTANFVFSKDSGGTLMIDAAFCRQVINGLKADGVADEIVKVAVKLVNGIGLSEHNIINLNVTAKTYDVELPTVDGGTVTIDNSEPVKGELVTITVRPEEGMEVAEITVKDNNNNSVDITDNGDGTYTYEQPGGNVKIEVTMKIKTYTVTFVDWDDTPLKTETVEHGKNAIAPANPTRGGYSFAGWDKAYDNVTGPVTVKAQYVENTGSRPYSGTIIITSKNDDGSTTKTTTNKNTGTKTEVTTNSDGSSVTVETEKDGTVITTENDIDGNTTITVEKADGSITTEEERKDGTKVTTETTADGKTTAEIKADKKTEVTIPVPDTEKVQMVIVTDENGNNTYVTELEVKDNGIVVTTDGNATVSVVSGDKKEFVDVHHADHWSEKSVDFVYILGLMNGTGEHYFSPDEYVTRAMLVTILYRAEGQPEVSSAKTFEDIESGSYYEKAVAWAKENEIVNGTSATTFEPDSNITREQIAAIMLRYARYKEIAPTGAWAIRLDYADLAEISDYAAEGVMFCKLKGIMHGKGENNFAPNDNATRAEAAAILERFIKQIV